MPGVADHLIERMRDAGVRALFGLPGGGGNLDLIQAAGRAGLPFVLTATETGSAIAAIAQAEITGAPGACITTLGPGAASVVNGVACAKLDRVPLLVITDSQAAGATFEHQRIDHHALLSPVTKWTGSLAPPGAFQSIDNAFARLGELPRGPVHLDCPADFEESIDSGSAGAMRWDHNEEMASPEFRELVGRARKPLLLVGLTARHREYVEDIRMVCEQCNVPALATYKAKGVVPDSHPWFGGIFTNGAIERGIIDQCDLLIGVGFDPVEILPKPWTFKQPVVSIASWEMPTDHVPFQLQHIGDIGLAMTWLPRLMSPTAWDREWIQSEVSKAQSAVRVAGVEAPACADALTAQDVVIAAAARFAGRGRVTVDAGAHMFPATVLWPVSEPNEMLISNGLSTMGFALPAAIGAGLLDRDRPVVALTGDGGLLICMGELATLAREQLNVTMIVFNDSSLSLIEIKQQARKLDPTGVALGAIDWRRIAEGFGLRAWTAGNTQDLDAALDAAAAVVGPKLIDARIDPSNYAATLKAIRG